LRYDAGSSKQTPPECNKLQDMYVMGFLWLMLLGNWSDVETKNYYGLLIAKVFTV
jgi:hypothetical protein